MTNLASNMEAAGYSKEDIALVAVENLVDSISQSDRSELSILMHRNEDEDNVDCKIYQLDSSGSFAPTDVFIDKYSAQFSLNGCRAVKVSILANLTGIDSFRYAEYALTTKFAPTLLADNISKGQALNAFLSLIDNRDQYTDGMSVVSASKSALASYGEDLPEATCEVVVFSKSQAKITGIALGYENDANTIDISCGASLYKGVSAIDNSIPVNGALKDPDNLFITKNAEGGFTYFPSNGHTGAIKADWLHSQVSSFPVSQFYKFVEDFKIDLTKEYIRPSSAKLLDNN